MIKLRNYQNDLAKAVRGKFSDGHKRVLAVLPCRAGKTWLFAYVADRHLRKNEYNYVWFIVHRKELVDQAKAVFVKNGLDTSRVLFGMVPTLYRHIKEYRKPTLIIEDECVSGDTSIQTADGEKPIKNIKKGDMVLSFNHKTEELEYKKVTRLFVGEAEGWHIVKTETNAIRCTGNHPIFVKGKGYVEAREVKEGDYVIRILRSGTENLRWGWERVGFSSKEADEAFGERRESLKYNIEVDGNSNYIANGILTHNCHHNSKGTVMWSSITDAYPNVPMIGLTATPARLDGAALGDIFDAMCVGVGCDWLTENGYLAPYDYYAPKTLNGFSERGSDYDMSSVEALLFKSKIMGDVMKYLDLDRKTIVYCPSLNYSKNLAETIGPLCVHVDGETPKEDREKALADFREGKIRVLTNYALFGEGVDVPDCDCVIMLRPTLSVSLYIQMAMRCLTYYPNKKAVIYDFVGNAYRHGMPTEDREWTLDGKIKCRNPKGEPEVTIRQCAKCFRVYKGNARICPYCGNDNGKTRKEIEQDKKAELEKIEKAQKMKMRCEVGRCKTKAELEAIAAQRGYSKGWVYKMMQVKGIMR